MGFSPLKTATTCWSIHVNVYFRNTQEEKSNQYQHMKTLLIWAFPPLILPPSHYLLFPWTRPCEFPERVYQWWHALQSVDITEACCDVRDQQDTAVPGLASFLAAERQTFLSPLCMHSVLFSSSSSSDVIPAGIHDAPEGTEERHHTLLSSSIFYHGVAKIQCPIFHAEGIEYARKIHFCESNNGAKKSLRTLMKLGFTDLCAWKIDNHIKWHILHFNLRTRRVLIRTIVIFVPYKI